MRMEQRWTPAGPSLHLHHAGVHLTEEAPASDDRRGDPGMVIGHPDLAGMSISDETRQAALRLLDNSLSQIVADARGVDLDGWPVEERRPFWERNYAATLIDTWSSAVIRVATGEVPW